MDLPAFRKYARAVYAATDADVAPPSDADLDRKVDTRFIGDWHAAEHTGEIAALKGLPF